MQFTRILLFLFAAIFSSAFAAPTRSGGGGGGGGGSGSEQTCGDITQVMTCCNNIGGSSPGIGLLGVGGGILSGTQISCTSVVPIVSGNCNGKVVCCDQEDVKQNGLVNLNINCVTV